MCDQLYALIDDDGDGRRAEVLGVVGISKDPLVGHIYIYIYAHNIIIIDMIISIIIIMIIIMMIIIGHYYYHYYLLLLYIYIYIYIYVYPLLIVAARQDPHECPVPLGRILPGLS